MDDLEDAPICEVNSTYHLAWSAWRPCLDALGLPCAYCKTPIFRDCWHSVSLAGFIANFATPSLLMCNQCHEALVGA